MTTDPPPADLEDVRIGNWQCRLPSAICTNKEIFDEIFSLETWKTVLQPDQRDRILKMLPPEILKTPGAAEKTIEDLFSKSLSNFDGNPLDTFYDKLENGHYDPEVVETKANIVREWRRESLRLRKNYHTKLLQDIVISRDQHLRKLIAPSPVQKKNGKRSISSNTNNGPTKRNGGSKGITCAVTPTNGNATNGLSSGGTKAKNSHQQQNNVKTELTAVGSTNNSVRNANKTTDQSSGSNKNKRGRVEAALLSPPNPVKDVSNSTTEGPSKKKAKSSASKSKGKKSKDNGSATITQPPPSPSSSQLINSPLLMGNGGGTGNAHQKTSLLLGTLTAGSSPLEPPTLSLRSPSSLSGTTSSSSLLESLTSPVNPVSHLTSGTDSNGGLSKQYSKIFPSPILTSSPVSTSQSSSFLPSPVQSSPILASQLQAPSPISVNLSTITGGGLSSSRNGSISGSPSHSSITLNYTQPPTPTSLPPPSSTITSLQQSGKGLMEDDSSSDEFEFETIEPTIGFSGPSSVNKSSGANLKSSTAPSSGYGSTNSSSTTKKLAGTISSQELANIQKCSLLTNCLTQPLSSNSSSAAAVSAALANNILTSTPVPASATIALSGGSSAAVQQLLQQQQSQSQKIIVTSSGIVTTSSSVVQPPPSPLQQQQQLQKFLTTVSNASPNINTASQKVVVAHSQQQQQHHQIGIFQQQIQKNVISAPSSTGPVSAVDAQTFVNTLMASSKDLLSAFSSSIGGVSTTTPEIHQMQVQQQHNSSATSTVLPISVNLQGVQEHQKQSTFIRTSGSVISQQQQQQLLSLQSTQTAPPPIVVVGQGSSLNTQSLQLPSSILAGSSNISSNGNKVSTSVVATTASIPNLLDSDDLNLSLGSFTLGGLGGMNLDLGTNLQDIDSNGMGVGTVDGMKLEMDCGMDKMDDLSGVLDGNPFDSIPNLSDELDGLDLDMVDGLCDFEVLLSEEKQYGSFFSLIRDVLCSTRDHRMTLVCLEKTVKKWTTSPGAALNPWFMRVHDWSYALIVGLNFLAGNYQDVHPEDFVPYIEYKYKTKYYQWIGAGRDGDNNLTPLCTLWMDNLDKLPPLRKSEVDGDEPEEEEDDNEDSDTGLGGDPSEPKKKNKRPQTPPPPRCTTEWAVRPSTETEKEDFRQQEKHRFENPHKAFTYRMHGYESVVGPVKGVYSSQTGITNKARGHSLLVDDRPPYVTILALVRDAVARLPNGEGTRSEICEMLRDSAFLAPEASNVTLNSVVSGALDRLHYERDPCVRYDSHKKSWIYLHRDRSQEQFERLHHNRSYTKSTKSRNNSNRKSRKGSKSSSAAVAVATGTSQSSSSSSSQCSTSAIVESSLQNAVASNSANLATIVGSASSGKTSSASNSPLVALPSLSTINPSIQNQLTSLASSVGGITSVTQQQQQQPAKQAIGLVSVTNPTGIQVQTQQTTGLAGALQQSLATVAASRGGLVSIPVSSAMTIQDGTQQQTQQQASLNDVLAAATGLRFQTNNTGAPIVLNQNILGTGHQQGKPQQATFIQETGGAGATARLVLQQSQQTGALSATMQQGTSTQAIQVQSQQQQGVQGPTAAAIAPGQILLNSSAAAVLKLAGNIRIGEGLRLAQLRLPAGASGQPGTASLAPASSALRLPQHRILLARGTLPGQSQAQGVLLGQTSTGQTVILSAGPAGAGPLAGLQQALAAGGSGATGQIQLHAAPPQTIQLDNSPASAVSGQHQQSIQTFTTNQTGSSTTTSTKFGIITNVAQGGNSLVVSSGASSSPLIQGNYSTMARIQQSSSQLTQQTNSPSTLPPTSISLPASLLSSSQTLSPVSTGNVTMLSPPNVTVSTSQLPPQQQQLILTSGSGGNLSQGQHQSTTQQQIGTLGMQTIQLQQQQQSHQSLILQQSQQNIGQSGSAQQQQSQTQAHHQLTAPIIIRSAQGDFVSFGIPSHLSLGRGVQGIKVIPFQAGKQTVLARIVAPPPTSAPSTSGAPTSTIAVPSSSMSSLLSGSSTLTSNNFNNTIASTIANITTSSNSTVPATVQQLTKVPAVSSSTTLSFSSTQNLNPTITYSTVMSTLSTSPAIVSQPTISLQTASLMSLPNNPQQSPMTTSGGSTPITTIHGGVAVTTVTATNNNSIVVNNQSSNVTAIAPTSTITTATVHNVSSSS